jgi:glycosyltransferase involved in cell wall biosynthesis
MELYKINEKKIEIITHGVLTLQSQKVISKQKARDMLGISESRRVLLFFGYLWEYKGLNIILKSLVSIKKEIKDVTLLIVGQPVKNWKHYEAMIEDLKLSDQVMTRLEYIPDEEVEVYFSAADVCVFPYKEPFDTHGGATALALSFKKPLIVTEIGGLSEYVSDERVISKPEDVDGLTHNIIRVLTDEIFRRKLVKDLDEIAKTLSWDVIAEKTIEAYEKTLTQAF